MDDQLDLDMNETDEEDTIGIDNSVLTQKDISCHLRERLKKKGCNIVSDDDRISRRRLNDILEDFGVPTSTDVHCKLSEMPTFKEVVDYISNNYEIEADELANEQDAYLPKHTADEQQSPVYATATA